MDENNFEKKMQEQMEELNIQPSASVWNNIESRIREKKPRKRFAWLFLTLLLGSLAGGYYFFNNEPTNNPDGYTQNKSGSTTILNNEKQGSPEEMISKIESISDESVTVPSDSSVQLIARNNKSSIPKMNGTLTKETQTQEVNFKMNDIEKVETATPGLINSNKESTDEISLNGEKESTVVDSFQTVIPADTPDVNAMIKDEQKDEELILMTSVEDDSANIQTVPKPSDLPKHKWVIGFTFSAGKSLVSEGILGIKAQEDLFYNDPGNSSGTPPGTGNPLQRLHTINPEYNTAFNAGIFAQKKKPGGSCRLY